MIVVVKEELSPTHIHDINANSSNSERLSDYNHQVNHVDEETYYLQEKKHSPPTVLQAFQTAGFKAEEHLAWQQVPDTHIRKLVIASQSSEDSRSHQQREPRKRETMTGL